MAHTYSADYLLHLRDSPLCTKPPNLPPAEEWMGTQDNNPRVAYKVADRAKATDTAADQPNRRAGGLDRAGGRNNTSLCLQIEQLFKGSQADSGTGDQDSDDVLSSIPPRSSFASSTFPLSRNNTASNTKAPDGKNARDAEGAAGRFGNLRRTNDGGDGSDRLRLAGFSRRAGGDSEHEDGEGWSTVKPRKSFGHEGSERFGGRMGGGGAPSNTDRNNREDRKPRDRDEHTTTATTTTTPGNRAPRNFEGLLRGNKPQPQDGGATDEGDDRPRNTSSRARNDAWYNKPDAEPSPRERIDKIKSWRDRSDKPAETADDRSNNNNNNNNNNNSTRRFESRWTRDRDSRDNRDGRDNRDNREFRDYRDTRPERDPEWLDEPAEEKSDKHTEEDFKKFMESMKAGKSLSGPSASAPSEDKPAPDAAAAAVEAEKPKTTLAPAADAGVHPFFMSAFPAAGPSEQAAAAATPEAKSDAEPKAKTPGKASRFTSFFNMPSQDESKAKTEPAMPAAAAAPSSGAAGAPEQPDEKMAFQQLLAKLQRQTVSSSSTPRAASPFAEPGPPTQAPQQQPQPQQLQQPQPQRQSQSQPLSQPQSQPQPQQRQQPAAMHSYSTKPGSGMASPEGFRQPFPGAPGNLHSPTLNQEIHQPRPLLLNQTQHVRSEHLLQQFIGHQQQQQQLQQPQQQQQQQQQLLQHLHQQQQHRLQQQEQLQQQHIQQQIQHAQGQQMAIQTMLPPHLQQMPPRSMTSESSNADFLRNLMRTAPDARATTGLLVNMGPPKAQQQMAAAQEREMEFVRDMRPQMRQMRAQGPMGYMEEHFQQLASEQELRNAQAQAQAAQMLQRGPPPGLDQLPPNWMPGAGQMAPPPPQQRGHPMMAPPGLASGPSRSMPAPGMFPPNFPSGGFPSLPEAGPSMPPRNMGPPPPGFYGGPLPPGFMGPGAPGGPGMGFHGPVGGVEQGFGGPFDGRHMPLPAAGAPGAMFRRQ